MAEWTYALASVAEFKQVGGIATADTGQDSVLEVLLKRSSEIIEAFLGREVVTRGAVTEYHTFESEESELHLLGWPIGTITSVAEGGWVDGTWTADDTLTVAAGDYLVHSSEAGAKLLRLSSGALWFWPAGFEAVKVVYSAGYSNTAAVPGALKDVCLSLTLRKYAEQRRGQAGAQSITDGMGSVTRYLPAELLRIEQDQLWQWRNLHQSTTGRRA